MASAHDQWEAAWDRTHYAQFPPKVRDEARLLLARASEELQFFEEEGDQGACRAGLKMVREAHALMSQWEEAKT